MTEVKRRLRILALHGFYQSDVAFSAKLGSLRKGFKRYIDFTFIKAPHKAQHPTGSNADENAEEYGWWFNNTSSQFKATVPSPKAVGFEESVILVEKIFNEQGPFDGILGFSQGAAFLAILCAMQQKKLSMIKFDFAILISGFKSLCESHSMFYDERLNIPSLHVYGTMDQIIPLSMTEDLATLFKDADKSIHDGGHYIPSRKEVYKDFIEKMLTIQTTSANDESM